MALSYKNLDPETRQAMAKELAADVSAKDVYLSPRLNSVGRAQWATLLGTAAAQHDDAWLAETVSSGSLLESQETATRNGKTFVKTVPATAPDMLAEGEFNRLYIRGLCVRAIAAGTTSVVVSRARESSNPRPESEAMLGQSLDAAALLQDLRQSKGKAPAVLPYVNSGLSVHLP
jgi:hypothetical protein